MTSTAEKQGCLGVLLPFLRPERKPDAEVFPYRVRDDFLSPAELSFYKVLVLILRNRYTVQSKVRLADIFFVAQAKGKMAYFNRISQRHLDFLVCDAASMKPLLGIELDDSSHRKKNRQERDAFVEEVFRAAKLPLVRFPVQRGYTAKDVAARLAPFLKSQPAPTDARQPVQKTAKPVDKAVPVCPKCGIPMVLRTVTRGEHKGKQFYGCANFPRCRQVKPLRVSKAE